jgi:anti-sigma regulatory factor (Ser/Thr protein kinase)
MSDTAATRLSIDGGVASVRPGAIRAADVACHLGVPADRHHDVQLAVHECLANALEHGHGGDGRPPIDVEVAREDEGTVTVRIHDDGAGPGRWRSGGGDPDRGRGRALVRQLVDEVTERSGPAGATVTLRWSTAAPGSVGTTEVVGCHDR